MYTAGSYYGNKLHINCLLQLLIYNSFCMQRLILHDHFIALPVLEFVANNSEWNVHPPVYAIER